MIAALTTILAGCTTPKPTIPYQNYQLIAGWEVVSNKCVSLGFMDYQTAAAAKNFAAQDLNSWTYDPMIYQSVYAGLNAQVESAKEPISKQLCDSFAVSIAQRQQRAQQAYQQQQIAMQKQQIFNQEMQNIQNSMPKTTYCNKIGWQTVCNTY